MISFDEAIELIGSIAKPLGVETVSLGEAAGRVLAVPVVAMIDSPRRDSSAMDGYAVRDEDLANLPAQLKIVGESFAGAGWRGMVAPGTCSRIFTGAPVPTGANHVVMQENVRREGDLAIIDADPGSARHIRKAGSDFAAGTELLPKGRLLDPRAIVAAAGADIPAIDAFRRPRVHILSTGDELAEPGAARDRADAIPESVSFGVAALAEQWGARCTGTTRLRDDLVLMQSAAEGVIKSADVIVVTGGASVGEKDFAKDMFAALGLQLIFSRVSIKPGKPVWLGLVGDRFVVGLPGNPTSALVTARLLLVPLLAAMQGRQIDSALGWISAPLGTALAPSGDRETFHRAVVRQGAAQILSFQDSSAQKALAEADVLVRQREGSPALFPGEIVQVLDF
jgi:molybdopterin molybdotransferase